MFIDCWFSYLAGMLAVTASVPTLVLSSVSESKFLNLWRLLLFKLFLIREKQYVFEILGICTKADNCRWLAESLVTVVSIFLIW